MKMISAQAAARLDVRHMASYRVNDHVYVFKYGDWYAGTVIKVKRTGTVVVNFTTKGKVNKNTTIDSHRVPYDLKVRY